MTRQELMQQIAALDQEINAEAAAKQAPRLNTKYSRIPWASWVSSIVMFIASVYAPAYLPEEFDWAGLAFFALAILLLLSALWRTIMFIAKGRHKKIAGYKQSTERLRLLQEKRKVLQKQLNETE